MKNKIKHIIENNSKTIINILIFTAFILPIIIILYLMLFGFTPTYYQTLSSFLLAFLGSMWFMKIFMDKAL